MLGHVLSLWNARYGIIAFFSYPWPQMAHYDVFREQLAIKYPAFGHALWDPTPRNPDRPAQVGDVGFIRGGKFYRLFNALLPANDLSQELGVPEYHEPLVPKLSNHIDKGSLCSNNYCSAGVSVEDDPGYYSFGPDDFRRVSFQYTRTRGAAVLSLPVETRRENTLAQGDFGRWIVRHIGSCFAFARNLGLGIEEMEEIILVTGCDRTRSWTNITFLGGQADAKVSFGVKVEVPDTKISFQLSPELVRGAVISQGPEGTNLPENQCVFIRGFRVARSFWLLPKQLKAAAGPSPDPGYDCDPDKEVVSMPAITKHRDPLHLLLDYIAEQVSDCDMVLGHDDDLAMINGIGHGTLLEALEPDVMMDLLRSSNIEIHKVLCDSSLIEDIDTNITAIKVAMLPMTFQSWITAFPTRWSPRATQNRLPVPTIVQSALGEPAYSAARTMVTKKRKALIIGTNYSAQPDSRVKLKYCTEDAFSMANFLCANLGFARHDVRLMTDDAADPRNLPTKDNILGAMRALVADAQPGDSFFFYFSGHGTQIKDTDGDKPDGLDECICTMDYRGDDPNPAVDTPGLIDDDAMYELMVKPLPPQSHLISIFDCCHSGTILDLPYLSDSNGVVNPSTNPDKLGLLRQKASYANVVSLSASRDNQMAPESHLGGALRWAFIESMRAFGDTLTYRGLFRNVGDYMKRHGFPQQPQLSSSHEIDTNIRFSV